MSPTPPAAANVTASPRASSLPRGRTPDHATPPERVAELGRREHEHRGNERDLEDEARAEQAQEPRESAALGMGRSQLDERQEDQQPDQRRDEQPRGPAEEPAVRESGCDERAGEAAVGEIVDPGEPRAVRLVARDAGPMSRATCSAERPVVGITGIAERSGGIEPVSRFHLHEPRADAGVDLEHARERQLRRRSR